MSVNPKLLIMADGTPDFADGHIALIDLSQQAWSVDVRIRVVIDAASEAIYI